MNILLTGGAGFIGSHVADLLINEGHSLTIIDDLSNGKKENIPENTSFYQLSITDPSIKKIFEDKKPDIVLHHAAQVSVSSSVKDPFNDMEINIKGTVQLIEASVKHKVKKIIFASTGGAIYGEHDYFPADENHPLRPLSPYGIGKLSAEKYLYFYYKTYELKYTTLRYSNVYGPRQDPYGEAGVVAIFTSKMLSGEQPVINGTGEQTRDFVFVKDVAGANLMALNSDVIGEVNISTGKETSVNQLFSMLKSITGSSAPEKHGPPLPGEQLRSVLSWEKAKKDLGWYPKTSLKEGLEETVQFFKQTKKNNP
jgi:UDP-glucose 4-epimerase